MATTSYEKATRCPKCEFTGAIRKTKLKDGELHTVTCMNERCEWYDTNWVVVILSDGSIAEREPQGPRTFPREQGASYDQRRSRVLDMLAGEDDTA